MKSILGLTFSLLLEKRGAFFGLRRRWVNRKTVAG